MKKVLLSSVSEMTAEVGNRKEEVAWARDSTGAKVVIEYPRRVRRASMDRSRNTVCKWGRGIVVRVGGVEIVRRRTKWMVLEK